MIRFIKRRLLNQKGAMDRIIVTILLILVGVGALVGLNTWYSEQSDVVKTKASQKIVEAQE
jgi:hypothetical protein